uniref:G-protein coupled receptors family 1 profile domain-containing protein n=1 Tax=Clytia hemisphaerica TaxID=252671 RepID=A0A7M5UN67_9CNID
ITTTEMSFITSINGTICTKTYGTVIFMSWESRISFLTINTIISIVNLIINIFTVYSIYRTNQIKNQSIKLILIVSISNALFAVFGQSSLSILLYKGDHLSCPVTWILLIVIEFCMYSSHYLTGMLGFDRYIRIKYQNNYHQIYTSFRFYMSLSLLYFIISIQAALGAIARFNRSSSLGFTLPINILMFMAVAFFYGRSIQTLRQHQQKLRKNSIVKSSVNLTRLATLYITTNAIFAAPIVVVLAYYFKKREDAVNQEIKAVIFYTTLLFSILHCPVNAICFLKVNRQARMMISTLMGKSIRKGSQGTEPGEEIQLGSIRKFRSNTVGSETSTQM